MEPQQVADLAGQMETDDAVALIEDLDEDEQQAVLEKMEPDDRAAVEEALELSGGIRRPPDAARPLRCPRSIGRSARSSTTSGRPRRLPNDFWEVFVVSPNHHPVGTCKLSTILRSPRATLGRRHHGEGTDADPGRHGPGRRRASLPEICARVRGGGRRLGPARRDDHRRRHDPHHPGRGERGRPAAVRRGRRGRHQRAGQRELPRAGPLADRQPPDRIGCGVRHPPVRAFDRAAGDPRRADADRRGGRRQCRNADAGGYGASTGYQSADGIKPLAGRVARDPCRVCSTA